MSRAVTCRAGGGGGRKGRREPGRRGLLEGLARGNRGNRGNGTGNRKRHPRVKAEEEQEYPESQLNEDIDRREQAEMRENGMHQRLASPDKVLN